MRTDSPALEKALRYLADQMHGARADRNARLPPIRRLASEAGVSYVSMWKAVRQLADEGRLVTNHRTGVRVAAPAPTSDRADRQAVIHPPARTKWQRVRTRIEADILNGVHTPGTALPPPKELSRLYGACHATLRRALDQLVDEHWLTPNRRTYRVSSAMSPRLPGTVVLLARGSSDGRPALPTNRSQDHFRALESECARNGVALRVVSCDALGNILHVPADIAPAFSTQPGGKAILGTLVWTIALSSVEGVSRAVRRCLRLDKPLAILDETGSAPPPSAGDSRVRVFSLAASAHAGRRVGTFLLQQGHREVVFVSPVHSMAWSRNRLDGVVSAFADAGLGGGVRALTAPGSHHPRPQSAAEIRVEQLLTRLPQPHADDDLMFARAVRLARGTLESAVSSEIAHGRLIQLLDRNPWARSAGAWAVVADGFAVDCVDYLRGKGVRVPEDISVIGFDDTHEAFLHGLTSYNFNGQALMHAMVGHVLAPRTAGGLARRDKPIEVDGFITVRRTTAPRSDVPDDG